MATSSRPNQCLPITLASCDWPAQDEIDITWCTPLHPDYSAGSHTFWRWWEGNGREEWVAYSHKLYQTMYDSLVSFSSYSPIPLTNPISLLTPPLPHLPMHFWSLPPSSSRLPWVPSRTSSITICYPGSSLEINSLEINSHEINFPDINSNFVETNSCIHIIANHSH